jgi:integrase/recombinase XerC
MNLKLVEDLGRVAEDLYPVTGDKSQKKIRLVDRFSLQTWQDHDKVPPMSHENMWLGGFADWLRAGGVSHQTLRLRMSYVSRFVESVGDPSTATAGDVATWLGQPHWSPNTRRVAQVGLRVFYRWALDTGLTENDPTKGIRKVNVPRGVPHPTPESILEAALENAKPETHLALLLGAYAGLRRAEIAGLHCEDIDLRSARPTMRIKGKGGHERNIPVHERLVSLLTQAQKRGGWVFPSRCKPGYHVHPSHIGAILSNALPEGFSAHALRHRFGTQVYKRSHDIRATQELLGHASVATTQRYVEVDDDALLAAVSNL